MMMTKLKSERLKRGWSQQVCGFHADVAASYLSHFETLRMRPYPDQAKRLGELLGLRPEELQELVIDEPEREASARDRSVHHRCRIRPRLSRREVGANG